MSEIRRREFIALVDGAAERARLAGRSGALLTQEHIELGHEHQPTFVPSPSALLQVGVDRHRRPSSLP
jgi:hypothetical protein